MSEPSITPLALGRFLGSGSNKKVHVTTINGQEVALMRGCSKCEINLLYELREAAHVIQVQQTCAVHTVAVELAEHGSIIDLQDKIQREGTLGGREFCTASRQETPRPLVELPVLGSLPLSRTTGPGREIQP